MANPLIQMSAIDQSDVEESPTNPVISTASHEDNTTPLPINQPLHLAGMVTSDSNNVSSPESLIQTLDTSLLKLQHNLAHNRAIFSAKVDVVMGRLKEMEEEVSKALQGLKSTSFSEHHAPIGNNIPNSVHSNDPSIVDEQQMQIE